MLRLSSVAGIPLVLLSVALTAQQAAGPRSFQTLRSQVAQVQSMRGILELRARWTRPQPVAGAQAAAPDTFTVTSQRVRTGTLRRERRPELAADRLVVVVLDRDGTELDWRIVADPRVLRAEVPGPDGTLTGGTVVIPATELVLSVPDLPAAYRVAVYEPRAIDGGFALNLLGRLDLTSR